MTDQAKEFNELRLNEEVKSFLQNLAQAVRQAMLIRTPALATVPVRSRRARLAQQLRSR
ncbi:MAG: hypothetical protein ACYCW6_07730 [Candidatus Xenobia bacterium]